MLANLPCVTMSLELSTTPWLSPTLWCYMYRMIHVTRLVLVYGCPSGSLHVDDCLPSVHQSCPTTSTLLMYCGAHPGGGPIRMISRVLCCGNAPQCWIWSLAASECFMSGTQLVSQSFTHLVRNVHQMWHWVFCCCVVWKLLSELCHVYMEPGSTGC